MSLSLTLFYIFMYIIMSFKNEISRSWNEEAWIAKIVIILSIFVGLLFISNSNNIIIYYVKLAKYIGFIFIIFEIVMLVDLCYTWGEKWIA